MAGTRTRLGVGGAGLPPGLEEASKQFLCFPLPPYCLPIPASPEPTLLSVFTKERYEGFAERILVSGLSHGFPAELCCLLSLPVKTCWARLSSSRVPGYRGSYRSQRSAGSPSLSHCQSHPHLPRLEQEFTGGPGMAPHLAGHRPVSGGPAAPQR